jgi:hypothetical protein
MRYYKYWDVYGPLGEALRFVEAEHGVAIREVESNDNRRLASNFKHSRWSLMLAEGQVDYDSIQEVEPITKEEFDRVWKAHLASREGEWEAAKGNLPVGTHVAGYIERFYPQGVIVDLGGGILSVANYEACRASTKPAYMYSDQRVTAVVAGYDEDNQWVILESPQVHEDHRRAYGSPP